MNANPRGNENTATIEESHSAYSLRQLAGLANVSHQRARAWVRAGLIQPVDGRDDFGFHQVRLATVLANLAEKGIGTARLRAVHAQLRRRFPNEQEALSQLVILAGLLVVRDDDCRLTAPDGQRLLDLLGGGPIGSAPTVRLRPSDGAGADDLFERAVTLEQAGEFERAAEAYQECLLRDGPDAVACFNLANVLSASGHAEAAIERYRQAVELDPAFAAAWNNLGLELAEFGKSAEALTAWRKAVKADPTLADAVFNLADALHQAGTIDEARPLWTAYLRLDCAGEWHDYALACLEPALTRR